MASFNLTHVVGSIALYHSHLNCDFSVPRRANFSPSPNDRICSWHFTRGVEFGPTRFPWNVDKVMKQDLQTTRTPRSKRTSTDTSHRDVRQAAGQSGESQLLAAENVLLREDLKRLEVADRYRAARMTFSQISHSDALVNY